MLVATFCDIIIAGLIVLCNLYIYIKSAYLGFLAPRISFWLYFSLQPLSVGLSMQLPGKILSVHYRLAMPFCIPKNKKNFYELKKNPPRFKLINPCVQIEHLFFVTSLWLSKKPHNLLEAVTWV